MKFCITELKNLAFGTIYRYQGKWFTRTGAGSIACYINGKPIDNHFSCFEQHAGTIYVGVESLRVPEINHIKTLDLQ